MSGPVLVTLPGELEALQARWLALGREKNGRTQQDELYAREFAEPFAPLFSRLPLHGAPPDMLRPLALISVLGMSWQPVALMAAWCRPERMLVLGTDESLAHRPGGEEILSVVARVAGIPRVVIDHVEVSELDEEDIYRAVRDFLRRVGDVQPRQVWVDITGGKKSMSASAALAGFLAGAPIVYVDYGKYDAANRIPIAGTEYPRLLRNPLEVMGDLEMRDIFRAFNRSDFAQAEGLAKKLAERLYQPREAECLAKLACGYGAWDRFEFESARKWLGAAQTIINRFAGQGRWGWAEVVRPVLDENLRTLDALKQVKKQSASFEDGVPLLAWYLAKARRVLDSKQPSLALLLIYAAVERYVDLCLWVDFGLDAGKPDYERVSQRLDRAKYDKVGRRFFEDNYVARELAGKIMFANGVQLLAALSRERIKDEDLGHLRGLSSARNKCEYEHGFLPQTPSRQDVERYLDKATEIVARGCGGTENLGRLMESCRVPKLDLDA